MAKLNPQGLARGDKGLMSSMIPPPGHVFVSVDLAAGEPSVSAHYSQDKNYYDACFGMVGKEPYYDGDLLRCDDIYIMTMSRSPIGKHKVRALFEGGVNGVPFVEQWMLDKEVIQKKALKKERALHKAMCLAGDALIRVKDKGFIPITQVSSGDHVWDGVEWVVTEGCQFMGVKECIKFNGQWMTPDHKVLMYDNRWDRADSEKAALPADHPSGSWTEVWTMVRSIVRDCAQRVSSKGLGRLWKRT